MKTSKKTVISLKLAVTAALALALSGCVLTKVVTVPMRIGGAVISIVPVVGNSVDEAIDTAADTIDLVPI